MAQVDARVPVCDRLVQAATLPCAWPFRVVHTLDEQLGMTDALVQCDSCGHYYLLELTQWPDHAIAIRTMRILSVVAANAERFTANVGRSYCDLQRHQQELQALQVSARLSAWQITLDVSKRTLVHANKLANATQVALVSWRQQET